MPQSRREWTQYEVKASPGAERWVIVRYRGGAFRIPEDAPIAELLRGVREGWQMTAKKRPGADSERGRGDLGGWKVIGAEGTARSVRHGQVPPLS